MIYHVVILVIFVAYYLILIYLFYRAYNLVTKILIPAIKRSIRNYRKGVADRKFNKRRRKSSY